MKSKILIGCAALQLCILVFMAGQREWIRRTGRTVYIRTAPVDPRDAMRGDYVRLDYDLSHVPRQVWRSPGAMQMTNFEAFPRDTRVYAAVTVKEDGVAELQSLGQDRPSSGLYIRGRTEPSSPERINVRYGLEALFLEQGKGLDLEGGRNRNGIQVPLEVKAAVSGNGIAVLQDYRWCALGIGFNLEFETAAPRTNGISPRKLVAATVQLLNASSNDVAVADLPNGHSLALVPDNTWTDNPWHWVPPKEAQTTSDKPQVIVLKPGQVHSIHITLDDPWWSVSNTAKPEEIKRLPDLRQEWNARFRFEYRPPDKDASKGFANENLLWHGHLETRAFSPAGSTD